VLFRGISTVNLDAKGRLALPVRYREQLAEASEGCAVVTIDIEEPCLLLYPLPDWEEIEAQLAALPNVNHRSARRLQRLLIGYASDQELDASGRLLLPSELRSYASLEKKVVLLGQGKKIEIWSEPVWTARRDEWLNAGSDSMAEATAELQSLSL